LEEETIEERINSKSIQQKIKKISTTGVTDARPLVHPKQVG